MKTFISIVFVIISVCLVWGLFYLCIPPVKDLTDKHIFKRNTQAIVETNANIKNQIEVEVAPNASINFATRLIKVEI